MRVKLEEYVKEWLDPVVRFVDMPERKIKRNIALMQSRVKCIKNQNKRITDETNKVETRRPN